MMEVARFDMLVRNGVWKMMLDKGWYPIVASETITFRKSLGLWDRFTNESRLVVGLALTALARAGEVPRRGLWRAASAILLHELRGELRGERVRTAPSTARRLP